MTQLPTKDNEFVKKSWYDKAMDEYHEALRQQRKEEAWIKFWFIIGGIVLIGFFIALGCATSTPHRYHRHHYRRHFSHEQYYR